MRKTAWEAKVIMSMNKKVNTYNVLLSSAIMGTNEESSTKSHEEITAFLKDGLSNDDSALKTPKKLGKM